MRKIIPAIIAALGLSLGVAAMATGAAPAPAVRAMHYHDGPVTLAAYHNPLFLSNVDMTDIVNGTTFWATDNGHDVPFITTLTPGSDMSEIFCVNAGGRDWCNLQDNLGRCMNVPSSGTYANFVLADSCVNGDTSEEFARQSVPGGWIEEERHTGNIIFRYDPSNCTSLCGDLAINGTTGDIWNFPAS